MQKMPIKNICPHKSPTKPLRNRSDTKMKVGRSTVLDYNNAKTKMEKSESDMIQAKYEVIFNCKILDFYYQENFASN